MPNNYNTNANGPDIDITVFYSNDTSSMYFEENIKILQHSGYRESCIAFFHGQGSDHDDITWTIKGTRADMFSFLFAECFSWSMTKKELKLQKKKKNIEDILEFCAREYKLDLLHIDEINSFLSRYNLELIPENITILSHETRGYSQGDYAKVYYSPEFLESAWGNKPDEDQLHTEIDHLFWDSPVYAQAEINGEEYNYWNMPGYETYEFKRDEFINWLARESGVDKDHIEALMPEDPEYK